MKPSGKNQSKSRNFMNLQMFEKIRGPMSAYNQ